MITIRNEKESDYRKVEELTRKAFYNLYVPGCFEHYLAHIMRPHEDFLAELDFVIEEDGACPTAMMVKELKPDVLDGRRWIYHDSPAMQVNEEDAQHFDEGFEKMEKTYQTSQEEFYILSHSVIQ